MNQLYKRFVFVKCILLRTPEQQLLCVGCTEVDVEQQPEKQEASASSTPKPKKDSKKKSKKHNKKGSSSLNETTDSSGEKGTLVCQLDAKLKWAVDEVRRKENVDIKSKMKILFYLILVEQNTKRQSH